MWIRNGAQSNRHSVVVVTTCRGMVMVGISASRNGYGRLRSPCAFLDEGQGALEGATSLVLGVTGWRVAPPELIFAGTFGCVSVFAFPRDNLEIPIGGPDYLYHFL